MSYIIVALLAIEKVYILSVFELVTASDMIALFLASERVDNFVFVPSLENFGTNDNTEAHILVYSLVFSYCISLEKNLIMTSNDNFDNGLLK